MQPPIKSLEKKARQLRRSILDTAVAHGGHIASSFSCTDIMVSLYYDGFLKHSSKKPNWPERDRFLLSKGHAETGLYVVLADRGFFTDHWIDKEYRQNSCRLGGHPDRSIPGVEITSGALGHGLGIGAGMSLAAKRDGHRHLQFVLIGDGECTEGSIWETAWFAAMHRLDRLVAIIDRNRIGSIDFIHNYADLEPLDHKWQAFGWETVTCNGHDFLSLRKAFSQAIDPDRSKPLVIIANTIKGYGVDFMENDPIWHVKPLDDPKMIEAARNQLKDA